MSAGYHHHTNQPEGNRKDLRTLKSLLPYLWTYRGRVILCPERPDIIENGRCRRPPGAKRNR